MDDPVVAELSAIKRKSQSKAEALSILNRELTACKRERDHYRQLLEAKYIPSFSLDKGIDDSRFNGSSPANQNDRNRLSEIDDLQRKLTAANIEIKHLRGEYGRERGVSGHKSEEMIEEIEEMREKMRVMSADLQAVLDEKEELAIERDAYRFKVHRLNHELQTLLKTDSNIDVDALVMENTYLKERFEHIVAEKEMLQQSLTKYKSMLERGRIRGNVRLGTNTSCGGLVVTHRQVQELLENDTSIWKSPLNAEATLADLRSLSIALLEALEDKSLALTHQRKANKILAQRVQTLESRLSEETPVYPSQLLVKGLENMDGNPVMDRSIIAEYKDYMEKTKKQTNPPEITPESNMPYKEDNEDSLPAQLQKLVLQAMAEISEAREVVG